MDKKRKETCDMMVKAIDTLSHYRYYCTKINPYSTELFFSLFSLSHAVKNLCTKEHAKKAYRSSVKALRNVTRTLIPNEHD